MLHMLLGVGIRICVGRSVVTVLSFAGIWRLSADIVSVKTLWVLWFQLLWVGVVCYSCSFPPLVLCYISIYVPKLPVLFEIVEGVSYGELVREDILFVNALCLSVIMSLCLCRLYLWQKTGSGLMLSVTPGQFGQFGDAVLWFDIGNHSMVCDLFGVVSECRVVRLAERYPTVKTEAVKFLLIDNRAKLPSELQKEVRLMICSLWRRKPSSSFLKSDIHWT